MNLFVKNLTNKPLLHTRQNHALEHATLHVLSTKSTHRNLAGYSDMNGFWIIGHVSTEEVQEAVDEALDRLQKGENRLAIHENCGTNFATSGILAGTVAWLTMLGVKNDTRSKLDRLPLLMSLVTLMLVFSRPLGPLVQARFTTTPDVQLLKVVEICRFQRGSTPLHRVLTNI